MLLYQKTGRESLSKLWRFDFFLRKKEDHHRIILSQTIILEICMFSGMILHLSHNQFFPGKFIFWVLSISFYLFSKFSIHVVHLSLPNLIFHFFDSRSSCLGRPNFFSRSRFDLANSAFSNLPFNSLLFSNTLSFQQSFLPFQISSPNLPLQILSFCLFLSSDSLQIVLVRWNIQCLQSIIPCQIPFS